MSWMLSSRKKIYSTLKLLTTSSRPTALGGGLGLHPLFLHDIYRICIKAPTTKALSTVTYTLQLYGLATGSDVLTVMEYVKGGPPVPYFSKEFHKVLMAVQL